MVREKSAPYLQFGKSIHRKERTQDEVFSIIRQYESEFGGIAEDYQLAYNRHRLSRLKWIMQTSLVMRSAHTLKINVAQVYRRYRTTIRTVRGTKRVLQVTIVRDGKPAWL